MITIESVLVTSVVVFTLVLILDVILLWDLRKSLHRVQSKQIRISSVLCLLSSASLSFLFVTYNLIKYIALTSPHLNQYKMKSLMNIVLFPRVISGVLHFIFVGYFITIKLEDAFHDTFLSMKRRPVYICFAIYVIVMCTNWWFAFYLVFIFSHWYPPLAQEPYLTLLAWTNGAYSLTSEMYFILILVMFNWSLFKFVRLTMHNNEVLSLEINNRFKSFVIKQTNLISIITIAFCIFQAIAYWKWVEAPKDNLVNLLYPVLFAIQHVVWGICICLTFKFNNKYYYMCCKYSHLCCIHTCTNLIKGSGQQLKTHMDYQYIYTKGIQNDTKQYNNTGFNYKSGVRYREILLNTDRNERTFYNSLELNVVNTVCILHNCEYFKFVFDALNMYDGSVTDSGLRNKYRVSDILDAFNHLLQKHDSEEEFAIIYEKLHHKMGDKICEYSKCKIYSRQYSRRRRDNHSTDTQLEEKYDEAYYGLAPVLDKMHSFYYHSYDTFARIKETQYSFRDRDDRISSIHKMVKSRREKGDRNEFELCSNKFTSDLKLKDNNIKNDIYSFGERLEYMDEKSEWFIEAKYSNMKSEFVENAICSISMVIYEMEYDKCEQYMNTQRCKKIGFSLEHMLPLLIYCNCDKYQAKWSETFRQIPFNESDESLKRRHSHFYYCSKHLRDLVEHFGSRLIEKENENRVFYHGVNQILYLTRTITKFNAPLSTSTAATIALNFSGDVGVVLELKYSSATYLLHAKYFDCAFFSDFVNEKECLFLGGIPMMIIINVINVTDGMMYRKYINALNIINCILNGTLETDNRLNYHFDDGSVQLCASLISYQMNQANDDFPEYIVNLLKRYCLNLNNIMVFWSHMDKVEDLKDVLCNDVNNAMFFDLNVILRLFPNLERIEYRFAKNGLLKATIINAMHHIGELTNASNSNLKYVVIHNKPTVAAYESNGWKSFQDRKKIIMYREKYKIDFNELHFKYNQRKQSNASKSMIKNVL